MNNLKELTKVIEETCPQWIPSKKVVSRKIAQAVMKWVERRENTLWDLALIVNNYIVDRASIDDLIKANEALSHLKETPNG